MRPAWLLRTVHTHFTPAKVLFEGVPARDATRFGTRTPMAIVAGPITSAEQLPRTQACRKLTICSNISTLALLSKHLLPGRSARSRVRAGGAKSESEIRHKTGNGGYSQRKPTAHLGLPCSESSYRDFANFPFFAWHSVRTEPMTDMASIP